ncbi:MAG TPA: hypothetical protein PLN63_05325 [Paludibacteraceae bacterium]|nr:hypothetical protein [Paludibacteraceae bacterium]HOU68022.1 hypothetical protein [Paludibacteraceae bacterium]HPH63021.1 hypothetical protein [Paludibacteraceae bacterium]HQF49947.1 hypothetical protein [Paludibacteraceae bacterium]HQJ90518.1 hypothetical protein [Paludibacteraceae bacterium]
MRGILMDENFDISVKDGTFEVGTTDEQNVQLIVCSNKGEFKEYPHLGVGAINYLKSVGKEKVLKRAVRVNLQMDGYNNPNVIMDNGQLKIEI